VGDPVTSELSREDEIIAVAAHCFERFGVQRTRIEDVADAVGISRAYFYQFFKNREALVDAVLARQLRRIVEDTGPAIWNAKTLSEALTEGAVKVVRACRQNDVFMDILRRTGDGKISQLSFRTAGFEAEIELRLWQPVLNAARQRGEIRPDLNDDEEILGWLRSILLLLVLKEQISSDEVRSIFRRLVVPGLVAH
jgi:AcrR family transcriptional regulator